MKEQASAYRDEPSQIVADVAVTVPADLRAALGNINSVKGTVRNHKRDALPKEPTSFKCL